MRQPQLGERDVNDQEIVDQYKEKPIVASIKIYLF